MICFPMRLNATARFRSRGRFRGSASPNDLGVCVIGSRRATLHRLSQRADRRKGVVKLGTEEVWEKAKTNWRMVEQLGAFRQMVTGTLASFVRAQLDCSGLCLLLENSSWINHAREL